MGSMSKPTKSRTPNLERSSKKPPNVTGGVASDDDAALLEFAATLQKAHDISAAVEKEQEAARKRPRHYLKNSRRTNKQYAQKCQKLSQI